MPRPPVAADQPLRSPAAVSRFLLTANVGLTADLLAKAWAADALGDGQVKVAVRGWLQFEFVKNPGAVFGIAQGQRTIFLIVSAVAVAFLTYLFAHSAGRRFYQVILGMLLAGVLGNMYDRVVYSYVRDMIHGLPGWRWPASVHHALPFLQVDVFPYIFNVADTLLCVGVGVLLASSFLSVPTEPAAAAPATPAAAPAVDAG
jgi:signal peptidase II